MRMADGVEIYRCWHLSELFSKVIITKSLCWRPYRSFELLHFLVFEASGDMKPPSSSLSLFLPLTFYILMHVHTEFGVCVCVCLSVYYTVCASVLCECGITCLHIVMSSPSLSQCEGDFVCFRSVCVLCVCVVWCMQMRPRSLSLCHLCVWVCPLMACISLLRVWVCVSVSSACRHTHSPHAHLPILSVCFFLSATFLLSDITNAEWESNRGGVRGVSNDLWVGHERIDLL